jgi:hypothetical protein
MKRFLIGAALAASVIGVGSTAEARPPIIWKVGEYQKGGFDAQHGDTIAVFMGTRNTPANLVKCDHWGGDGLILTKWRGRWWEVCWDIDF